MWERNYCQQRATSAPPSTCKCDRVKSLLAVFKMFFYIAHLKQKADGAAIHNSLRHEKGK